MLEYTPALFFSNEDTSMTTIVKIQVPAGANWRAMIRTIDQYGNAISGNVAFIEPGTESTVYCTDNRSLLITE